MSMVEEERRRSDREHAVLLKRISFLSEELDEVNRQLNDKVLRENNPNTTPTALASPSARLPFRPCIASG